LNNLVLDTDLLALLPPWYREILDYQQICRSEESQLRPLSVAILAVADNFFFQTMDASAISQWEQIFNIVPNQETETLAFRQSRILNRISTKPPFTLTLLYQKLNELIGPGEWTVTVDYPNYTLYIESSAENQDYETEVSYTANHIKPAHIVFINTPYTQSGLLLNETIELLQRIYNYKLGAWGLGIMPFASEQEQGVIKLPTTPSVQNSLIMDIADFVSSTIATACINGSISITGLTKSVTNHTLTVTYPVSQEQATKITQADLMDADGNILTSSTVYVPVTALTIMKHVIPISEGVINNG